MHEALVLQTALLQQRDAVRSLSATSRPAAAGGLLERFDASLPYTLTPDKETGLGNWTEEMFLGVFHKGTHMGVEGRPVLPPMPWQEYRNMTDDDLKAVWAFLRSIKPIKNTVPDPKVPPPVFEQFAKYNQAIVDMLKAGPPK